MLQLPTSEARNVIPSQPAEDTTLDRISRHKAVCEQMVCLWLAEEDLLASAKEINSGQLPLKRPAGLHEINQKIDALTEERGHIMQSFIDEPPVSSKAASALIFYVLGLCEDGELDDLSRSCLEATARSLATIASRGTCG